MKKNIFREYDIRGIVGSELIIENVYELAKAITGYFLNKNPSSKKIIVGRDGRLHSPEIHKHIIAAILDMGLDVIDVGICPTPAVYFAAHHLHIDNALMITASHNPGEYNGIKLFNTWGEQIQIIRKMYEDKVFYQITSPEKGSCNSYPIIDDYVDYLASKFPHLQDLDLHAIIDCGNGSAGTVMPQLIKKMGWKNVHLLFEEVNGTFPNHEADPTVPENMTFVADYLKEYHNCELGIGLDGDCDRMNPMTRNGKLVPGDNLLALFASKVIQENAGATIICDIKSSGGLLEVLKQWGAKPVIAPSGHSNIKQAMLDNTALLGGELSCHFFFHDRYFGYDDGIYAILRLFELLVTTQKSLEELLTILPVKVSSPEFRITCESEEKKAAIVEDVKKYFGAKKDLEVITIDGIRAHMDYGWGLARVSNTQPVISLRFESNTKEGLAKVKSEFARALSLHFDEDFLKENIEL